MSASSTLDAISGRPEPTEDLDQAKSDVDEYGYCLIANALVGPALHTVQQALRDVAAAETAAGTVFMDGGPGNPNQRVWQLLNKGEAFVDLACHPIALEMMRHVVGVVPLGMEALDDGLPQFLLGNIAANIAGPGGVAQGLHADQVHIPLPWAAYPQVANMLWMLDDFTEANGATQVVPGSHKVSSWPDASAADRWIPAEGPAGTVMVFEGRTWHGTGANTTADQRRLGILAYYCSPFLRQQENSTASVAPDVLASASPTLRRLMGFDAYLSYGMIDGPPNVSFGM